MLHGYGRGFIVYTDRDAQEPPNTASTNTSRPVRPPDPGGRPVRLALGRHPWPCFSGASPIISLNPVAPSTEQAHQGCSLHSLSLGSCGRCIPRFHLVGLSVGPGSMHSTARPTWASTTRTYNYSGRRFHTPRSRSVAAAVWVAVGRGRLAESGGAPAPRLGRAPPLLGRPRTRAIRSLTRAGSGDQPGATTPGTAANPPRRPRGGGLRLRGSAGAAPRSPGRRRPRPPVAYGWARVRG